MAQKKFVISGGNSGIGLEAGRQLVAEGHHVILLGRDPQKGQAALDELRKGPGSAEFYSVDLSSHAGVRDAATKVQALHQRIDGVVLGAGVLTTKEMRTADGLHPIFAVNYLSRYHLTQLLLPQLKAAGASTVVLLVAGVSLTSTIDFNLFPKYQPFPGMGSLSGIQIANYHYVQHLAKAEPSLRAAVVNVGLVKTEIMRDMPLPMKIGFAVLGPIITVSVERAAHNATWLSTHDAWTSGNYWVKPAKHDVSEPLKLDSAVTEKVVSISKELTGA